MLLSSLQNHAHASLVPTAPDAQQNMLAQLQFQNLTFAPFLGLPQSDLGNGVIDLCNERVDQGGRTTRVMPLFNLVAASLLPLPAMEAASRSPAGQMPLGPSTSWVAGGHTRASLYCSSAFLRTH
jgi:hypothetical protein